jgi:hypothetical protein
MMRPRPWAHMRQHRLGHSHDAIDVDIEDILGLGDRELFGRTGRTNAGIVDQNVDVSEPLGAILLTVGQLTLGVSNATFGILPQTVIYAVGLGYLLTLARPPELESPRPQR